MTQVAESSVDRISRRQVDKFAERRAQLADSALLTLSELGYARTSLREIAQNSEFSHGVLHYYFRDKVDLITHCVREYKARCVTRYDQIAASATTADELRIGFAAGLAQTMAEDAHLHRLWYDLRGQSMFEASFREDVAAIDASLERMIWRIVCQYSELTGSPIAVSPPTAYAIFDGLFQHGLVRHLFGHQEAREDLRATVEQLLTTMVVSTSGAGTTVDNNTVDSTTDAGTAVASTERALEAMVARDWAGLRPLLHPYLHWTEPDGTVVRGRSNVMALLNAGQTPAPPTSFELRDGQIYRWRSAGDQAGAGPTTPMAGDTLGRPPTH